MPKGTAAWKAECPLNRSSANPSNSNTSKDGGAFTGAVLADVSPQPDDDMIMLPESVEAQGCPKLSVSNVSVHVANVADAVPCRSLSQLSLSRFVSSLKHRLSPQRPEHSMPVKATVRPDCIADVNFVSHGPFGILDLGASQTVIGKQQVNEVLQGLPSEIAQRVQKIPCDTVFRFGNNSAVNCQYALLVPLAKWYVKICVVNSQTTILTIQ